MKTASLLRRRLLQGGLGALVMPAPFALSWAQSEGATKLLRLPKHALVIGNSDYQKVPLLRNPGNDAKAIAAALAEAGFAANVKVDASRAEMVEAMRSHVRTLTARKSVGLFYFAGHGVQLGWRNYLLPVDASIASAEDIPGQCVDVGGLIGEISRAANPMNVIILDACRDNPFGTAVRLEQKGLSQMDAPPGTLLAFATAPGNLASDGMGANGLYTENLLREIKVREAKIEDVFKRVRLGVRRASNGSQIPWESTSLEEDFYFLPPEQLKKLSREEEERQFQEEQALYEQAKDAKDPAPLEAYLRRHPSGRFAELAQLRLDRLLAARGEQAIAIPAAPANPHTAGTARSDTRFKVGDSYTYRMIDRHAGSDPRERSYVITGITNAEVVFNNGRLILDLLGNNVQVPDGRRFTARQDQPLEYAVGKKWSTRFGVAKGDQEGFTNLNFKVAARERITVPAGTFNCFRVEGSGTNHFPGRRTPVDVFMTYWSAPDEVRRPIASERVHRIVVQGHVKVVVSERQELVSFRQS